MSEQDFADNLRNNKYYKAVEKIAEAEGSQVLPICANSRLSLPTLTRKSAKSSLTTRA